MRGILLKSLPPAYDWREYPRRLKHSVMEVIENEFTEALLDFFDVQENERAQDIADAYFECMMLDFAELCKEEYGD